jgi:hypothetical protein
MKVFDKEIVVISNPEKVLMRFIQGLSTKGVI